MAGAILIAALFILSPALGVFTVPTASQPLTVQGFTTPSTLVAPSGLGCTWPTTANPTSVDLNWTNGQAWSTTQIERNVNGGAYSNSGSPAAASVTTVPNTSVSSPASNQYGFKAKGVIGSWTPSGYSNAITDETCKGAINELIDGSVNARLNDPYDVAVDSVGNVFIADQANHRIRCIAATGSSRCGSTAGYIYTFAGDGTSGTTDNNVKTTARVNNPRGVWIDRHDNLLIADTGNNSVRIVYFGGGTSLYGQSGMQVNYMYTVAGVTGSAGGYAGDGVQTAINSTTRLNGPQDIATDSSDNLYIADGSNNRIRCVRATARCGATNGWIYTYAGTGTAGYVSDGSAATHANSRIAAPTGLSVNSGGSLIIGDKNNSRIRMVYWSGETYNLGTLTQGNMYSIAASQNAPWAVATDSNDNVLWADSGSSTVKAFFADPVTRYGVTNPSDNSIHTIAGSGGGTYNGTGLPPTGSTGIAIATPYGVAIDPSAPTQVYVTDFGRDVLRKVDYTNGFGFTWAGIAGNAGYTADTVPAHGWEYSGINHTSTDSQGNIYFADSGDHRIRKWIVSCSCLVVAAGTGGTSSNGDGGSPLAANINAPQGVHVDSSGNIYIAETGGNKIRMVPATGMTRFGQIMTGGLIYTILGNGSACTAGSFPCGDGGLVTSNNRVNLPRDVIVDGSGNLIVSDGANCEIRFVPITSATFFGSPRFANTIYNLGGTQRTCSTTGDGAIAFNGTLNLPDGIDLDGSGNVLISEASGYRIRMIAASNGYFSTFAGSSGSCGSTDGNATSTATLCNPGDVSYNSSNGAVYIADTGNDLIRKVASGSVSTLAGGGSTNPGDTGPARGAMLVDPVGITAKAAGDLYVAQNGSNVDMRVVKGSDP